MSSFVRVGRDGRRAVPLQSDPELAAALRQRSYELVRALVGLMGKKVCRLIPARDAGAFRAVLASRAASA